MGEKGRRIGSDGRARKGRIGKGGNWGEGGVDRRGRERIRVDCSGGGTKGEGEEEGLEEREKWRGEGAV